MQTDDHVGVTVRLQKKGVLRGGHITNGIVAVEGDDPGPLLTPVPPTPSQSVNPRADVMSAQVELEQIMPELQVA